MVKMLDSFVVVQYSPLGAYLIHLCARGSVLPQEVSKSENMPKDCLDVSGGVQAPCR